jgi:hypothetical protein
MPEKITLSLGWRGMWGVRGFVHMYNPSYWVGIIRRISNSRSGWAKLQRSYLKNKTQIKGLRIWLKW